MAEIAENISMTGWFAMFLCIVTIVVFAFRLLNMLRSQRDDSSILEDSYMELMRWNNELHQKEKECCPEDMRFWEYIEKLKNELRIEKDRADYLAEKLKEKQDE